MPFKLRKLLDQLLVKVQNFLLILLRNIYLNRKNENNFNQIEEKLIKLSTLYSKVKI